MISESAIHKLPKTDVHLHLDGSIRLGTLLELADEYHVALPSRTIQGLKETVFRKKYENLPEYLAGFAYTVAVLQSEVALERVAYELAIDSQQEGVRYIEVRFAPQLHVHAHLTLENVLKSVNRGLDRAKRQFNARAEIISEEEPPFEYSIIVCALRFFAPGISEYYDHMLRLHRFSPAKKTFALTSLELAQGAVRIRDEYGLPITGFDLAGQEAGYPADDHWEAFQYAHEHFMMKTVHAGEAYGPESIFQAITELHADRIGHGMYLLDTSMIVDPKIDDREAFVEELAQYIADRRITIEICLTSNMQTNPTLTNLSDHPYRRMRDHRLSTTFCTDNRTVSDTTVTNEIMLAIQHLGLTHRDLKSSIIYGFKRSFFPGTYLQKRAYVRQMIDYYEKIEAQYPELVG